MFTVRSNEEWCIAAWAVGGATPFLLRCVPCYLGQCGMP